MIGQAIMLPFGRNESCVVARAMSSDQHSSRRLNLLNSTNSPAALELPGKVLTRRFHVSPSLIHAINCI